MYVCVVLYVYQYTEVELTQAFQIIENCIKQTWNHSNCTTAEIFSYFSIIDIA